MSDTYYRERAARRTRLILALGALVLIAACATLGVRGLLYDACTRSFDRAPNSVLLAFAEAVSRGDAATAQECWEHQTYYDLEAGCSEICLSRVYGAAYRVTNVAVGEPQTTAEGRANLETTVSIVCDAGGQAHSGTILLDGIGTDVPWRHWAIVRSSFGGTVAEPWCK